MLYWGTGICRICFFFFLVAIFSVFFPQTFQTHRSFACLQFTPQKNRYFPAQLHFVMFRFKCCFVNALFPCVTSVPRGRGGAGGGFFYFLKIKLACEQFFLWWCFPSRGCVTVFFFCFFFALLCTFQDSVSRLPRPAWITVFSVARLEQSCLPALISLIACCANERDVALSHTCSY